jgi:hypothetical protein
MAHNGHRDAVEECLLVEVKLERGIPVSIHNALNRLIASETSEYLTFVLGTVIGVRAASG